MKKQKLLSVFLMLMVCVCAWAQTGIYKAGDVLSTYTEDCEGFTFKVISPDKHTAYCCATTRSGEVTVPAYFVDKIGTQWHVTSVSLGGQASLNDSRLILSEGILELPVNSLQSHIKSLYIPSTVKKIDVTRVGYYSSNLVKVEVADDNPYYCTDANHTMVIEKGEDGNPCGKVVIIVPKQYVDGVLTDITELTIPEGVTSIQTVSGTAKKLKILNIPSTFSPTPGDDFLTGFYGNGGLTAINVDPANSQICSVDGIVYTKDMKSLVCLPAAKLTKNDTLDIPEQVEDIWAYACRGSKMGHVKFNNVKTIGAYAFAYCQQLSELHLGDNVVSTGENSFLGCTYLTSVTTGDSFVEYGKDTFMNCTGLETFTVGKNVTTLGTGFIANCTRLTAIKVEDGNPFYSSFDDILYTADKKELIICPGGRTADVTMPDETELVRAQAFYSCTKISSITIGENVKEIRGAAFYNMDSLTEIYIGPSVENIGTALLNHCSKLKSVTIGNKVQKIDNNTFYSCAELENVIFEPESSVESIDNTVFTNTPKLKSLTFPKSVKSISGGTFGNGLETIVFEDGSNLASWGQIGNSNCPNLKSVDFGNANPDVKLSLSGTFQGLKFLESVTLPCTVNSMSSTFDNCTNLKQVVFRENENPLTIGSYTFRNTAIEEISLPNNTQSIASGAFNGCKNLKNIDIPASTTSIDKLAFVLCSSLTDINVAAENKNYASSDGMLCDKAQTTLIIFPGGKANDKFTLLPPSLETLGDYSLYSCENLKNICIPKKVTKIGSFAFHQSRALEHIYFLGDEPVSDIGTRAFGYQENADLEEADAFLKNHVTITVRKNGNEGAWEESDYWKDCKRSFSFIDDDNLNEYLPTGNGDALLLKSYAKDHSVVIPATVTKDDATYRVSVGDYAFEDIDSNVKEIIFEGPVEYMGACAFKDFETQTTNIENVFLTDYQSAVGELSTNRFNLPADKYQTIDKATQHIYVPKSLETEYKEQWTSHADNITYKIPGIKIGNKFGTFSREFDVDLDDDMAFKGEYRGNEVPSVVAFRGYLGMYNPYDNYTYIRMRSINCDTESNVITEPGDGTYIPAGTGVLLRAFTSDMKSPDDFYYRIGEQKGSFNAPDDNVMTSVTENGTTILPYGDDEDGHFDNYIFSGSNYYPITKSKDIPVHLSYLHVHQPQGAKVKLVFDSEDDATGIEDIYDNENNNDNENGNENENDNENGIFYNLQGQRVNSSAKGIVIKNGSKFFVR